MTASTSPAGPSGPHFEATVLEATGVLTLPGRDMTAKWLMYSCAMALTACGSSTGDRTETCLEITTEYRAELDRAIVCDPAVSPRCILHGAVVLAEQRDTGEVVLKGICTNCPAQVNPARTERLDEILSRYKARGCEALVTCPAFACPPVRSDPTYTAPCTVITGNAGTCEP